MEGSVGTQVFSTLKLQLFDYHLPDWETRKVFPLDMRHNKKGVDAKRFIPSCFTDFYIFVFQAFLLQGELSCAWFH